MTERTVRASRLETLATGVLAIVATYLLWLMYTAWGSKALLSEMWYAANVAAVVAFAGLALVVGFHRWRRGARASGGLVLMALLGAAWAGTDAYVLATRYDTSGPGGDFNFTNARWWKKYYKTNEAGFWERSLAPYYELKPEDRFIVAAAGDSFTFGEGSLGAEHRFTNRLQGLLQQAYGPRIEVLNFALGNGDTKTETGWITAHASKVHPDLVVDFYLANDIVDLGVMLPPRGYVLSRAENALLVLSPGANFLYWRYAGPFIYGPVGNSYFTNLRMAYVNEERMGLHLGDVEALVKAAVATGATPAMVILPFPHLWNLVTPEWKKRIYGQILGRAAAAGALVLDLSSLEADLPPEQFQLNPIDGHPNPRVHGIIAERVYQWMASDLRIGQLIAEAGLRQAVGGTKD